MTRIGFYVGMSHCLLNEQKNLLLSFASALKIFYFLKKAKNEHPKKTNSKKMPAY